MAVSLQRGEAIEALGFVATTVVLSASSSGNTLSLRYKEVLADVHVTGDCGGNGGGRGSRVGISDDNERNRFTCLIKPRK